MTGGEIGVAIATVIALCIIAYGVGWAAKRWKKSPDKDDKKAK